MVVLYVAGWMKGRFTAVALPCCSAVPTGCVPHPVPAQLEWASVWKVISSDQVWSGGRHETALDYSLCLH